MISTTNIMENLRLFLAETFMYHDFLFLICVALLALGNTQASACLLSLKHAAGSGLYEISNSSTFKQREIIVFFILVVKSNFRRHPAASQCSRNFIYIYNRWIFHSRHCYKVLSLDTIKKSSENTIIGVYFIYIYIYLYFKLCFRSIFTPLC